MQPAIRSGQFVVVDRFTYSTGSLVTFLRETIGRSAAGKGILDRFFHAPQRGDVIAFRALDRNSASIASFRRVIGLPGDTIEIRRGIVLINGRQLNEPYVLPFVQDWGPSVVRPAEYFVLADDRSGPTDSRVFDTVPLRLIIGKARISYWPPTRWGIVKHYNLSAQLAQ